MFQQLNKAQHSHNRVGEGDGVGDGAGEVSGIRS